MASFFNLTLDTLAPAGLSLILNDGAQYATSATVTAKISVSDTSTTGYQMKIWGTKTAGTEATASWETFAATKSITLPDGDGLKTIYVKVRDDVGNESESASDTITLNTSIPAVTITGPDKSRISKVTGYDAAAFSFVCDVDFEEYTIRVVPATSSLHTAGRRSRRGRPPAACATPTGAGARAAPSPSPRARLQTRWRCSATAPSGA